VKNLERVNALRRSFEKRGFEGFLVNNEYNLLYLTGFQGATCLLVSVNGESAIYVYSVNYEQAKAEGEGFDVVLLKHGEEFMDRIAVKVDNLGIKKLAADALSLEDYRKLEKRLKGKTKTEMHNRLLWELRKVKDEKELRLMRKAAQLSCEGMQVICEVMEPGIREYEVAAEIEYSMRKKGSGGLAFDTIIASGVRSAFPHGGCTDREIRRGDLVVVDVGATYQYYRSDLTRTFVVGKPSEKQARIYEVVKQAQEAAFQRVRSKIKAKDVDEIARKVIRDAGYGEYFVHGLGHGVGLEVHEPPTLNQESKDVLNIGNVVTIEPGIYTIGFGGVRIEDTVLVHENSGERLTKGLYSLSTDK
jgi:Xaa-Pro aminopeptidase